jgi:hypothetical protein
MSRRIKPHKVRGRELEEVREKDPDGRIVYHHRTVDTLGKMLRAGTIDQAMHDAAKDFQAAFIIAQLDPLRALPILRVPGTGREPELNERQLNARRRVHEAMRARRLDGACLEHGILQEETANEVILVAKAVPLHTVREQEKAGILDTARGENDEARRHDELIAGERPDAHACCDSCAFVGLDFDHIGVEKDPQILRFGVLLPVDLSEAHRVNQAHGRPQATRIERKPALV